MSIRILVLIIALPLLLAAAPAIWTPTTGDRSFIDPSGTRIISKVGVDPIRQMTCESYTLGRDLFNQPTVDVVCYDAYRVYWAGLPGACCSGAVSVPSAGTATQTNPTTEGTVSVKLDSQGRILSGAFAEGQAKGTSAIVYSDYDSVPNEVVLEKGGFAAAVYDQGGNPVVVGTSSGARQTGRTSSSLVYNWNNQRFTIGWSGASPIALNLTLS